MLRPMICALALSMMASQAIAAKPPSEPPTPATHAGVPVSDFVTISWDHICGGSVTSNPVEIMYDGAANTGAECAYLVPEGKVLVLTDVEWIGESTSGTADAGKSMEVHIWITEDGIGNTSHHIYHSRVDLDDSGVVTVADHLTVGLPVKFGLVPVISFGFSNPQGQGRVSMKLRGYYIYAP